jgi:hypothetical protein
MSGNKFEKDCLRTGCEHRVQPSRTKPDRKFQLYGHDKRLGTLLASQSRSRT